MRADAVYRWREDLRHSLQAMTPEPIRESP
jgi:hypothetical protein